MSTAESDKQPEQPLIEVEELHLALDGDLIGYWARGHVDKDEFIRIVKSDPDFSKNSLRVRYAPTLHNVRHVWWRCVPVSGERGHYQYFDAVPRSRGAFRATVWNYVDLWMADIQRQSESVPA